MQQPEQPGPPVLGCTDCPIKCGWNLLPSILALSILTLFTFIGNDTISNCTVRIDRSVIQQLLIWQFFLILEFGGATKLLLDFFKTKGLEHIFIILGAMIALLLPVANFALMFRFPDSCSQALPAYFVTVYWIFSSMSMLFSFTFIYYALKPCFAEITATVGTRNLRRRSMIADMKVVAKFPVIMGKICSPAKYQNLWKQFLVRERVIPEQERLWKYWDYQHLIFFFSYRIYYEDLDIIKHSLRDLLYDKFVCHICNSRFHQLDFVFVHPVLLYVSHVECLLKNPTGMSSNVRYRFWQSISERFRSLHELEVRENAVKQRSAEKTSDPQKIKETQMKLSEKLYEQDTDTALKHRLSSLGNRLCDWLSELAYRFASQEAIVANSQEPDPVSGATKVSLPVPN